MVSDMRYIKKYNEGFEEMEFIRTATYRGYVKSGFAKPDLDEMLDWRNTIKRKMKLADEEELHWLQKELQAIDFILKRHFSELPRK
jgi:hypothetical protein